MPWDSDRSRADRRAADRAFLGRYGDAGPWRCFHCGGEIFHRRRDSLWDKDAFPFARALVIHHIDYDPRNNHEDNVVPSHHGCNAADMNPASSQRRSTVTSLRQTRRWAAMSPQERTEALRKVGSHQSAEGKARGGRAAAKIVHHTKLPDGRSVVAAKAGAASAALSPEALRARALKAWETRRRNKESISNG
jgi:hypothetical protein